MKLLLILVAVAVAAAAPGATPDKVEPVHLDFLQDDPQAHSALVNALIRQLIAFIRRIINEGSSIWDIPPLDPLELDHFRFYFPAGIINLDLDLKDIFVTGLGSFLVHKSELELPTLILDLEISVPVFDIRAREYDLIGDLFTAIPLYGKGQARFIAEDFRFKAKALLKQSENEKSILIEKIESVSFYIPSLKSELTGAIGGGDIDAIVNAMIEEVILDYVNRFSGVISIIAGSIATVVLNPVLEELDTWKYVAPLMPK